MRITVDESAANSLYRWLSADPELSRNAELSVGSENEPGGMGVSLDVVNVVLSNAISFSSLMVAVASWRGSRPTQPVVRVERDGIEVPPEPVDE